MSHLQPTSSSSCRQLCRFTWAMVLLAPGTAFLSSGHAGFKQGLELSLCQGSMTQKSSNLWESLIKSGVPRPSSTQLVLSFMFSCMQRVRSVPRSFLAELRGAHSQISPQRALLTPALCPSTQLQPHPALVGLWGCFGVRAGPITHTQLSVEIINPGCHETRNPRRAGVC